MNRIPVTRSQIALRTLLGRCPNCGYFGIFKNWFRLQKTCPSCGMELEKEESGFYFGTTSVDYVHAIILVIIPVCILDAYKRLVEPSYRLIVTPRANKRPEYFFSAYPVARASAQRLPA